MKNYIESNKQITEKFEFRTIRADEADEAVAIEQICFPPHEACSEKHMKERIEKAPEMFLVAVDKENGKIAGFLNGIATDEPVFRDEFFTDANLHIIDGKNVMLVGLDVLPEYRGQGLATEIMYQYIVRERENNRELLVLTCLSDKVEMYKKMGYKDKGISASVWGNEEWHEMSLVIGKGMITYDEIIENENIKTYIIRADESLAALGFTEHSFAHVMHVAEMAGYILETLGYDERTIETAKIAGYLHDIGNLVNRKEHSQSGAVMAWSILNDMGCDAADMATIVTAIGNHDEGTGVPVNAVAAAMILADKADVRRSRVRNNDKTTFDIHDRVNYSVEKSKLKINQDKTIVKLKLQVDTRYGSVMDYFEIFMERMILCRKAAEKLGLEFKLIINEQQLI